MVIESVLTFILTNGLGKDFQGEVFVFDLSSFCVRGYSEEFSHNKRVDNNIIYTLKKYEDMN